eukprot:TRINITY_DN21214_c0_g1_i3.p1 TRINITY_DN21214_c0_g1~~TRINITY_DN21214_c0_g1_i3.p1  ORF type:complete len:137 (+),score=9.83 TRINITY_DN21214_c0_g1_i3:36-446(+)
MWEVFFWWAFYAHPSIRALFFCALVSTRFATVSDRPSPFCSPFPPSLAEERERSVCSHASCAEPGLPTASSASHTEAGLGLCNSASDDQLLSSVLERVHYTRTELLAVTLARLTSEVTARLRSHVLCVDTLSLIHI